MLVFQAEERVAGNLLLREVSSLSGVRVQDCYQCGKCTAGCPVATYMDLTPRQVMRAVQLGRAELVLTSSAIWLCASCQTCSARCPMEIDVAHVMDTLRHLARQRGVPPAERGVVLTHRLFLQSVQYLGRVHELGLVAGLNLLTGRPLANVRSLGVPLFLRGKLHLLPRRAGGAAMRRLFASARAAESAARTQPTA